MSIGTWKHNAGSSKAVLKANTELLATKSYSKGPRGHSKLVGDWFKGKKKAFFFPPSQDGWGWESALGPSAPIPTPAGTLGAWLPAPCPGGFGRSPRRRPQNLSGSLCQHCVTCTVKKCFLGLKLNINQFAYKYPRLQHYNSPTLSLALLK